jgi:hypothetical protein
MRRRAAVNRFAIAGLNAPLTLKFNLAFITIVLASFASYTEPVIMLR